MSSRTGAAAPARLRDRSRAYAVQIGERLLGEVPQRADSRGLEGPAGFALLYAALAELTGDARFAAAMHSSLRTAARTDDRPEIGLFNGISGLRAAAALACRNEPRYAKLVGQCDAYVDEQMPRLPSKPKTYATYDLISGWSGARLARGVDAPLAPDELVTRIVWTLDDRDRWRCPHPIRSHLGPVNDLGMAHGLAGMVASLALTVEPLDGAVRAATARATFDLRNECIRKGDLALWPSAVPNSDGNDFRSAWCYGAAGALCAVHAAARALGDGDAMEFAHDAMRSLAAQPGDAWHIEGAALCHGLMGNALCFASFAFAAGDPDLWHAAFCTAENALDDLEKNEGICWARGYPNGWYDSLGILDGACGAALGLLTLCGDADSTWMRLFGLRSAG